MWLTVCIIVIITWHLSQLFYAPVHTNKLDQSCILLDVLSNSKATGIVIVKPQDNLISLVGVVPCGK